MPPAKRNKSTENNLIPYIILEANPDYKRPYVETIYGMAKEDELNSILLEKMFVFVYNRSDINQFNNVSDVSKFWNNYYSEYYMSNSPWEAKAVINNKWVNVTPSDINLFDVIMKTKKPIEDDEDDEDI